MVAAGWTEAQKRAYTIADKSYQTSLGFFDQAIAAPSMKAVLAAWGADSNLSYNTVALM